MLIAIVLACLLRCSFQIPEDTPFDSIAYRLNHAALFQQMFPQEKVYLHFEIRGISKGSGCGSRHT